MKEVSGLRLLETTLKEAFSLSEVVVVSGDSDQSPWVKNEMGRASVSCIKERLVGEKIPLLLQVVQRLPPLPK